MIEFILNDRFIRVDQAKEGMSLLDFIRKEMNLTGTKTGCREGDCGACTVLAGEIINNRLVYRSVVSCLTPLINAKGKHIVTIEGLNTAEINPVQKSIADNSATQCGFCTPGFVVSLTDHMLSNHDKDAVHSLSGNICRCTGYKSIEKAAKKVDELKDTLKKGNEIGSMVEKGWLPHYFLEIKERLLKISSDKPKDRNSQIIGGATDLMVQKPGELLVSKLVRITSFVPDTVEISDDRIFIGAGIKMNDFFENKYLNRYFPGLSEYLELIASSQIRNMATPGGNIVNASPIGDISVLLLALNADLILESEEGSERQLKLRDLFLDYKKLDLKPSERIKYITIEIPAQSVLFNFEKVSKRTHLDIASVNSSVCICSDGKIINEIYISAGGVAPYPKLLVKTSDFLKGKELSIDHLNTALDIIQEEIFPISDIRGSAEYKRTLLRQLFLMHFVKLFPQNFSQKKILSLMLTNAVI